MWVFALNNTTPPQSLVSNDGLSTQYNLQNYKYSTLTRAHLCGPSGDNNWGPL